MSYEHLRGVAGVTAGAVGVPKGDTQPGLERPRLSVVPDAPEELAEYGTRLPQLSQPVTNEDWQERALCAQTDPEAFFPEKGGSTREAKKICQRCPVRQECLEYALANDERFGIWGGLSERERRRLKRGIS